MVATSRLCWDWLGSVRLVGDTSAPPGPGPQKSSEAKTQLSSCCSCGPDFPCVLSEEAEPSLPLFQALTRQRVSYDCWLPNDLAPEKAQQRVRIWKQSLIMALDVPSESRNRSGERAEGF